MWERNKEKNTQNAKNTLFPNRQESIPQENTEARKGKLNKWPGLEPRDPRDQW